MDEKVKAILIHPPTSRLIGKENNNSLSRIPPPHSLARSLVIIITGLTLI